MNLAIPEYGVEVSMKENIVDVITIENAKAFRDILLDIWNQYNGGVGKIVLSENLKDLKFSKYTEVIFNPFAVDCNNRKIISKLYSELQEQSLLQIAEQTAMVNQSINRYLEQLTQTVPYPIMFEPDFPVTDILKAYNVKIVTEDVSLTEKLINYIKINQYICNINVFFFVNLKGYLLKEELKLLYQSALYDKAQLIIIEDRQSDHLSCENHLIIDSDLCIIKS